MLPKDGILRSSLSPSWPGLTRPPTYRRFSGGEHDGWVYIMTNRRNGILYIGVTDIRTAIQREKNLKHWSRAWKVRLILEENPNWDDLHGLLA
jgi:hypothetical protein